MKILFVKTMTFGIGALICFIGGLFSKPDVVFSLLCIGIVMSIGCLVGCSKLTSEYKSTIPDQDDPTYTFQDFLSNN